MTSNPFNQTLDWAVRGKYARVRAEGTVYEGWIERIHHGRGSVVMHDVTTDDGETLGHVFVRTPETVEVLKPHKRIEFRRLGELTPHPDHDGAFTPSDDIIRRCYRNRYAGSFPVVREGGEILNGHKRVEAARLAGLERHPVEVVTVTDEQARELFQVAHRSQDTDGRDSDAGTDDPDAGSESDGAGA